MVAPSCATGSERMEAQIDPSAKHTPIRQRRARSKHEQACRRSVDASTSSVLGEAHVDQAAHHPSRSRPAPGFQAGRARRRRLCASWPTTCWRRCTTRPASALPRSRSASRCACWSSTSPRKASRRRRRSSSIPRSCDSATSARSTRKAACRSRTITPRSSARPRCAVRYLDRDGKQQEVEADGLLATCLQHEIDHLERRAVHRPHLEAEARHGGQEVQEARQGPPAGQDGRLTSFGVRLDRSRHGGRTRLTAWTALPFMPLRIVFMGTPDFSVPTLARDRRGRAMRSSPSTPSRRGRPAGAGWS